VLSGAVLLIFAKALGQLIAPVVMTKRLANFLAKKSWNPFFCCAGFNAFYGLAIVSNLFPVKFIAVVVAHFFSNLLYSINVFAVQSAFKGNSVGTAFAKQYQTFVVLSVPLPFLAGLVSEHLGAFFIPALSMILFGSCWFTEKATRDFRFFTQNETNSNARLSQSELK
jgi:MFS transporter, DHA3 family, macrolide efflux protein